MPNCKINETDLRELADLYNSAGKHALYDVIRNRFSVKIQPVYLRGCVNIRHFATIAKRTDLKQNR